MENAAHKQVKPNLGESEPMPLLPWGLGLSKKEKEKNRLDKGGC